MKKRLRVALIGANGRMGREIAKILASQKGVEAFVGVVREGKAEGFSHSAKDLSDKRLSEADVWIDFSSAEGFDSVLKAAVKASRPLVSGVTGISAAQKKLLKEAGKKIPMLWSANMSLGIAALKKALSIAGDLEGFDFQIEEIHHRHKKDKPSGTALALQDTLASYVKEKLPEPLALRGGGVFGVHKVWMMSEEETLCFEHQALNRTVFAKGAVKAALWLSGKKAGLYSTDQLFGE